MQFFKTENYPYASAKVVQPYIGLVDDMNCSSLKEKMNLVHSSMENNFRLRLEPDEFGNEFETMARNELRETPENIKETIEQLRSLIEEEDGLKIGDEDEDLKTFLRPTKYYTESAFKLLRKYYRFRVKHPQYFGDLLPSKDKAAFIQNLITILPSRNSSGERILIIEAGRKWNPKECSLVDLIRASVMLLQAAVLEPRTQVAGVQIILDMQGLGLSHIWQFTPSLAKDIVEFIQECMPLRIKAIHIVNQPYVFNMLFSIFKPFLCEKLRKRIHFHGVDFNTMQKFIERKILPHKYSGNDDVSLDQGAILLKYLSCFEQEYKEMSYRGYTPQIK